MALSVRFHSPYLQNYSSDPLSLILKTMDSAQRTLDICTDHLTLEAILTQAAVARGRGVKVRFIIDFSCAAANAYGTKGWQPRAEQLLNKYGFRKQIDWRAFNGTKRMMHQRFVLIDGQRVLLGSTRLSGEGLYLQDNLDVLVESAAVGAAFEKAAEICWNECGALLANGHAKETKGYWPELCQPVEDVFVGPEQRISAYFMPYDGRILLEKLLEITAAAERSVHFALPSFGEPQLIETFEELAKAGVHVSGVVDARGFRFEHLKYAPNLREAYRTGRIQAMMPFARAKDSGGQYFDGMSVQSVTVDSQWTFTGSSGAEHVPTPYQAESALIIDSGPVARQCIAYVEALTQLAKEGGHSAELCRGMENYKAISGGDIQFQATVTKRAVIAKKAKAAKAPVKPVKRTAKAAAANGKANGKANGHANGKTNGKASPTKETGRVRKAAPSGVHSWAKRKARAAARKRVAAKSGKSAKRSAAA